ncbi:MAG TPA: AAA family ATPase [Candidatus Pacearchaeota archaeon]|jgi:exonuclease SbcC|nr:AAA family ATPase [Candidatus Pacearchaeota archaeon]|tara:strand:- start:1397 stop:3445 length:2049 start_codon:yes stop_codon:yes gene_type:complete
MLLKKLVIENLRSYENQTIQFPKGSTLLSGDIGSGKTTILLAIEFALFGLQPSQKGNSLLRNGADTAKVILEFEVEKKEIIVERTLKRKKHSINQDYVSITIDNEKFEESVSEVKAKILDLLNYPKEFAKKTNLLYKFTVYTPQEEMKQIIMESKDIRLNTLRHVFGIDKYKRIQENASILNSKLRERIKINQALYADLDELKERLTGKNTNLIESKEGKIESEEDYINKFRDRELKEKNLKEIKEKIDEKQKFESDKEKNNMLINEKKNQISRYNLDTQKLKEQIEEVEKLKFSDDEYNSVKQRIIVQKNKHEELHNEYIEIISKIKALDNKKAEANSLIKQISGLDKCPTCLQQVSLNYKDDMLNNAKKEIDIVDNNIYGYDKRKNDLIEKINVVKNLIEKFEKQNKEMDLLKIKIDSFKEKESRMEEIQKQIVGLNEDVLMLQQQILRLNKEIKSYDKYDIIFNERTNDLKEAKDRENKASIRKAEISKEIEFLEEQIKELKERIEKKENMKNDTDKLKGLENWISGRFLEIVLFTEKQVMSTLKHEFSNLFSRWFSNLVSENLTARLEDDFSPIIEQNGFELDYQFLSGGERTAIALAYRLSLNQVINSILSNIKTNNLVILDEPTDGFSTQQLEKMREVLEQLDTEQLILVSHEQKMEDFVDNIIRIEKEAGVSNTE